MISFDTTAIQTLLTYIAFGCTMLNHAIRVIAGLYTFKGCALIPILCWMWAQNQSSW
jgi:undecaprenyl-diphosphatase